MKKKIAPICDQIELQATMEVTKLLAFYGLLSGLRSLGGDQRTRLEQVERSLQGFFATADIDLSDTDTVKFRQHARKILDELLERVVIDDEPFKMRQ